jgi:MFS family permease
VARFVEAGEGVKLWVGVGLLNLVLALAAYMLVPEHSVATTDRAGYEWIAQHGLAPGCPHADFCYRVLVPSLVGHVPLPAGVAWGLSAVVFNAAAGLVLGLACARLGGTRAALLSTLMAQTSFGFTFAVFDPYTPDPAVFLAGALLVWAWLTDRPLLALGVAVVGVFAKETVALLSAGLAIASLAPPRLPDWRRWVGQAVVAGVVLAGFHLAMDVLAGWSIAASPAADLAGGSWLGLWLRSQQPGQAVFLVFIPFGFGLLFAALGLRSAPDILRRLALGLVGPLLILVYVQNVERALGNAFLVVIPASVVFLTSLPFGLALLAVITNGLLTARVGLSTAWLPTTPVLLVVAGAAAAWSVLRARALLRPAAAAMLLGLLLAACSAPGSTARTPSAPTATAEAVGTQARQTADAAVRRILAGNPAATPTPSPTPVPRPTCTDAIWSYEAGGHVGENRTVQGQVVRVRRLEDGTSALELGQLYPDPTAFVVLVGAPMDEQRYLNRSVCVAGVINSLDGTPSVRVTQVSAIIVVT